MADISVYQSSSPDIPSDIPRNIHFLKAIGFQRQYVCDRLPTKISLHLISPRKTCIETRQLMGSLPIYLPSRHRPFELGYVEVKNYAAKMRFCEILLFFCIDLNQMKIWHIWSFFTSIAIH